MEIRQKTKVTLRLLAECPTHSRTELKVRDVEFVIDEPVERGGTNNGPSPTETAVAAFLGCTNTIGNKCAKSLDVDIGHLSMEATCVLDRRGVTLAEEIELPFTALKLTVRTHGSAQQADLDRVAEETEKYCPLSKLFKAAGTEVEVIWVKA